MRIHFHFVRLLPLFFLFAHCGSPVEPPSNHGELMPMEAGNYWIYQTWPFATPDTARAEITRKVSVTIDGVTYEASAFLLPYNVKGTRPPFEWLYWNGPDGLYWLGGIAATDTLLYKSLLFKYPAKVGESWTAIRINYDSVYEKFYFFDTLSVSLVSKNEAIETPGGGFNCYVYSYRRQLSDIAVPLNYYHYYVPGLGRVAYITRWDDEAADILDEMYLISHELK